MAYALLLTLERLDGSIVLLPRLGGLLWELDRRVGLKS